MTSRQWSRTRVDARTPGRRNGAWRLLLGRVVEPVREARSPDLLAWRIALTGLFVAVSAIAVATAAELADGAYYSRSDGRAMAGVVGCLLLPPSLRYVSLQLLHARRGPARSATIAWALANAAVWGLMIGFLALASEARPAHGLFAPPARGELIVVAGLCALVVLLWRGPQGRPGLGIRNPPARVREQRTVLLFLLGLSVALAVAAMHGPHNPRDFLTLAAFVAWAHAWGLVIFLLCAPGLLGVRPGSDGAHQGRRWRTVIVVVWSAVLVVALLAADTGPEYVTWPGPVVRDELFVSGGSVALALAVWSAPRRLVARTSDR